MAQLKDIKMRIVAVSNTMKITRTMEMVATSKMKRWKNTILASKPYNEALAEALAQLVTSSAVKNHPLLAQREPVKRSCVVVINSNRGLCGAFNTNICKKARDLAQQQSTQGVDSQLWGLGKKSIAFFKHQQISLAYEDRLISESGSVSAAFALADKLGAQFLSGQLDSVHVAYSRFKSAGRQETVIEQLLPLSFVAAAPGADEKENINSKETDFIFEPSPAEIVDAVLPSFLRSNFYRMVAENITSEQAARRKAMKQATDNAEDMVTDLTRIYNRERQALITRELAEIISGADAIS